MISIHEEQLEITDALRKLNESIRNRFMSFARLNTEFKANESFKTFVCHES